MQIHSCFLWIHGNDIDVAMFISAGMRDIVLWVMLAIPASGILSVAILLRDEIRAVGAHRVPR